ELYGHENLVTAIFAYGKHGVELFFMISGFVIFWSLKSIRKPSDFVVSRFARLYPVYWASVITTFTLVAIFGLPGREVSFGSFLGNFLMFHNYLDIPNVDGVYWTLKVELTFYAWMLLLILFGWVKKIQWPLLLSLVLSAGYYLGYIPLPWQLREVLLLTWIPFFAIGISLFKYYERSATVLTHINILVAHGLTVLIFGWERFLIYSSFTLILYLASNRNISFLKTKPLLFLGGISYVLYLIHQNIGYIIINSGYRFELHPLVSIAIAIPLVFGISVLLRTYVERPAARFIKRKYGA
ncbi:MAG: acyltransferase, partial [Marinirhabdus sp.]|nr:acyltransferase [Marinirhabdus sp.]